MGGVEDLLRSAHFEKNAENEEGGGKDIRARFGKAAFTDTGLHIQRANLRAKAAQLVCAESWPALRVSLAVVFAQNGQATATAEDRRQQGNSAMLKGVADMIAQLDLFLFRNRGTGISEEFLGQPDAPKGKTGMAKEAVLRELDDFHAAATKIENGKVAEGPDKGIGADPEGNREGLFLPCQYLDGLPRTGMNPIGEKGTVDGGAYCAGCDDAGAKDGPGLLTLGPKAMHGEDATLNGLGRQPWGMLADAPADARFLRCFHDRAQATAVVRFGDEGLEGITPDIDDGYAVGHKATQVAHGGAEARRHRGFFIVLNWFLSGSVSPCETPEAKRLQLISIFRDKKNELALAGAPGEGLANLVDWAGKDGLVPLRQFPGEADAALRPENLFDIIEEFSDPVWRLVKDEGVGGGGVLLKAAAASGRFRRKKAEKVKAISREAGGAEGGNGGIGAGQGDDRQSLAAAGANEAKARVADPGRTGVAEEGTTFSGAKMAENFREQGFLVVFVAGAQFFFHFKVP